MLCRDCASNRSLHVYQVQPARLILAAAFGLAAGTAVGLALTAISGYFLFWLVFIASAVGGFLGEVILRLTARKRGPIVEVVAGVSVVGGAILALGITVGFHGLISLRIIAADPVHAILFLVTVGLTAAAAIGKIRYL
jgi:hypothetical protein